MTRIEFYLELERNPREYDLNKFCINKVYQHLATCLWERYIKDIGSTYFFGRVIYVGTKHAKQKVYITFYPIELH